MRELKFTVFLLALASLSFAGLLDSMQYVLPGVIITIVIILALLQMFSTAIQLPQLESWVKNEIREVIVAAVLIIIVFTIFSVSTNIITLLSGKPDINAATASFFDERLSSLDQGQLDLMRAFHQIGLRSGFSTSAAFPIYWVGYTGGGAPFSGYSTFFIFLSQASQGLTNAYFIYSGLNVLMKFLLPVAMPLLFLAFVFRVIPFTRQFGNTFIALIIGGTILLPFSVILLSDLHKNLSPINLHISESSFQNEIGAMPPGSLPNVMCTNFVIRTILNANELGFSLPCYLIIFPPGAAEVCRQIALNVVYPVTLTTFLYVQGARLLAASYWGQDGIANAFEAIYLFLFDVVKTVSLSYIDVVIIGIIVVVGTKSISSALGGEVFLSGIQRLL